MNKINDESLNVSIQKSKKLSEIINCDVFNCYFRNLIKYPSNDNELINKINQLIIDSLRIIPKVSTFRSIFESIAQIRWQEYYIENIDDYTNVFGKICSILRDSSDFDKAVKKIIFLDDIKRKLNDKYNLLYDSMKKYFYFYKSTINHKIEILKPYQDNIAKLSALYVAKSKEDFKIDEIEDYCYQVKPFFKLNLNNPEVKKYIHDKKRWILLNKMFQENDLKLEFFLKDIAKNYDIDYNIIEQFIKYKKTKLESIIDIPDGYNDFIRYTKALKLINRLKKGYIKYNDIELNNHRDIINNKYEYIGRPFSNQDIINYKKYQKISKIFDKVKREIVAYMNSLNIDNNNNNIQDELDDLRKLFPFNDEYFVFDNEVMDKFKFGDLYNELLIYIYKIKSLSFNKLETYSVCF